MDGCSDKAVVGIYGLDDPNDTVIPTDAQDVMGDQPDHQAAEEIAIEEESTEEAIRPRVSPDRGQPTLQRLEQHRVTHTPFRSWCKWCVIGRARGTQHRAAGERTIPIVGLDYFYMTAAGVKKRTELDHALTPAGDAELGESRKRGETTKCIVVRCSATKAIFAHVVPCKGMDEDSYVTDLVTADIEWLGHTRLILKADNEGSLQAVVRATIRRCAAECSALD